MSDATIEKPDGNTQVSSCGAEPPRSPRSLGNSGSSLGVPDAWMHVKSQDGLPSRAAFNGQNMGDEYIIQVFKDALAKDEIASDPASIGEFCNALRAWSMSRDLPEMNEAAPMFLSQLSKPESAEMLQKVCDLMKARTLSKDLEAFVPAEDVDGRGFDVHGLCDAFRAWTMSKDFDNIVITDPDATTDRRALGCSHAGAHRGHMTGGQSWQLSLWEQLETSG
eukprot:CAMPEP_0176092226 /NCGR_PEP_ID=MMETSP0120_2-20121206/46200_1 /TAXON_ID=160619 /ORGANISM="Kryptoperidinium foliaceum, Strain CCMP 1326" /LENGTH=221 /DNA_ID=CAMNT_0017426133 /DNA_START=70 /DNA_END=732 /DNA_ORIENTATION=-